MKHENSGHCLKCDEIFKKFPDFNYDLYTWFIIVQAKYPELHISCAGRGRIEQEECYHRGASRAHYGHSSHNYNAAIDTFFLINDQYNLDKQQYLKIEPEIPNFIEWYGKKGAQFYELPHFEIVDWRGRVVKGLLRLVE